MGAAVARVSLPTDRGLGPGRGMEDGPRLAPVPKAASQTTVLFKVHGFVHWAPSITYLTSHRQTQAKSGNRVSGSHDTVNSQLSNRRRPVRVSCAVGRAGEL